MTRLAADASYSDVSISPDDRTIFALRSHPDRPPHVSGSTPEASTRHRPSSPPPSAAEGLPRRGVLERVTATADDGVEYRVLAPAAGRRQSGDAGATRGPRRRRPAGHVGRLVVALERQPPGRARVCRAHARPGDLDGLRPGVHRSRGLGPGGADRPYTDVMVAVDGALERPDLDASRTALMGGSFGGYMANWVAGHTDRFAAIITHASLWALRPFHGTTDDGVQWEQEFGDPYVGILALYPRSIRRMPRSRRSATPMLVIHGELDARVPISGGAHASGPTSSVMASTRSSSDYPDESHWVLKPQNARLRDETVLAFLDHHVLGREWVRPDPSCRRARRDTDPPSTTTTGQVPSLGKRPSGRRPTRHDPTSPATRPSPRAASRPTTSATTPRSSGARPSTRASPTSGSASTASRPRRARPVHDDGRPPTTRCAAA